MLTISSSVALNGSPCMRTIPCDTVDAFEVAERKSTLNCCNTQLHTYLLCDPGTLQSVHYIPNKTLHYYYYYYYKLYLYISFAHVMFVSGYGKVSEEFVLETG